MELQNFQVTESKREGLSHLSLGILVFCLQSKLVFVSSTVSRKRWVTQMSPFHTQFDKGAPAYIGYTRFGLLKLT